MRPAALGLVTVWLLWGTNWPLWKAALHYTGPIEFMAIRALVSSALLVIAMLAMRRSLVPRPFGPLILIGLLQGVGMNGLSVIAVADSGATKATIFAYTMPFWTVLFARLLLNEEIQLRHWIAMILGMVGLGIVAMAGGSSVSDVGAALAMCGGICWALGTVIWKRTISLHKVDPMAMVTWQNVFSIVPLYLATWFLHEPAIQWAPLMIFAFFYNVVLTAVLCWFLWYYVVDRLPAVTAGMSTLAIPVVSILGALLFIGERPAPAQWLGIAFMLAALAVVTGPATLLRSRSPLRQETL